MEEKIKEFLSQMDNINDLATLNQYADYFGISRQGCSCKTNRLKQQIIEFCIKNNK